MNLKIPKIIHQTCADKSTLRQEIDINIEKIKKINPGWEHRIYDNNDIEKFITDKFDKNIIGYYKRINPDYGPAIADFFRYLLIYKCGGVYIDIKSTIEKPLDTILTESDSFLLSQWNNRIGEKYCGYGFHNELSMVPGGEFQQWHIIAEPNHPLLAHVINRVCFNINNYSPAFHGTGQIGVLRTTGPICYTLAIAPHLKKYPLRIVNSLAMGFKYTIYNNEPFEHRKILSEKDYTKMTAPVIINT